MTQPSVSPAETRQCARQRMCCRSVASSKGCTLCKINDVCRLIIAYPHWYVPINHSITTLYICLSMRAYVTTMSHKTSSKNSTGGTSRVLIYYSSLKELHPRKSTPSLDRTTLQHIPTQTIFLHKVHSEPRTSRGVSLPSVFMGFFMLYAFSCSLVINGGSELRMINLVRYNYI